MSEAESAQQQMVGKLERKISNLLESMSLQETFLAKFNPDEDDLGQVKPRLDKLEEQFDMFFDIAAQLEAMSTEKMPISLQQQRFTFESKYYAVKADLLSKLPKQDSSISSSSGCGIIANPELPLVEFDGRPEHWVHFRDSFTVGVINRAEMQGVDKLHYLKGLVHGYAARLVSHVEVSEEGFRMAWKILQQRYDSKRWLIFCHLETLYGTLPMQNETRDELLRVVDSFEEQLANLKRLGEPTEHWSSSLVYQVYTRLDDSTRREWDRHIYCIEDSTKAVCDPEFPKFDQMVGFLQGYARILPPSTQAHNLQSRRPARDAEWTTQQQS